MKWNVMCGLMDSISFFLYFARILREHYPEEMTVDEFRGLMLEILKSGGINSIEHSHHLERLFERLQTMYCPKQTASPTNDSNTAYVESEELIQYQRIEDLQQTKIPVKTLLMAIMHAVHGETDDRVKAIFRLFKEWVEGLKEIVD